MLFYDRHDAGRRLAAQLAQYGRQNPIILALPRGGVVVGYEVAISLGDPLEVLLSRKIGAPGNQELAIGAVAEIDGLWVDEAAIAALGVTTEYVQAEAENQRREIRRMIQVYRQGRPLPPLEGRTVIVVDDGIATGYTMLAAAKGVGAAHPTELVIGVPVAPRETLWRLSSEADRIACLAMPEPFYAVGSHYVRFDQLTDEDVVHYLEEARKQQTLNSEQQAGSSD